MLIGICGGIIPLPSLRHLTFAKQATYKREVAKCAGKKTVAQYLVDHHGFTRLHLDNTTPPAQPGLGPPPDRPGDGAPPTPSSSILAPESSVPASPIQSRRGSAAHTFSTVQDLLDFVTKRWRSRWVTTEIETEADLEAISRRPFFILLSVDAPVTLRWRRLRNRGGGSASDVSLEDFVAQSDRHLFDPSTGVMPLVSRAAVRLVNTSSDLAHLYATLGKLDLTNPDRLRPSWDRYFMSLASLAAQRSNCMKRAVGCVLVGRERRVISTGYNGTPRNLKNCHEGGCPRCNSGEGSGLALSTCLCLHAEENALLEAGRERIREGTMLYCDTCPCLTCSIKIVQMGISEVIYSLGYRMDGETADVFKNAGVRLRQFTPPADGLIHLEKPELY